MSVCMVLSPGKADVLYLPGNRRLLLQKPRFTGEAPVFTYKTLTASLAFLRLNLKWRLHTHTHTQKSAVGMPGKARLFPLTDTVSTLVIFAPRPCRPLLARDSLSDAGLEICHFKTRVKWPLWLLIGLSPSITPVLCIAPFIRAATATNTLNLSSFDLP